MDLPKSWRVVQAEEAAALEAELARELSPAHVLRGVKLAAVARNLGRDDVLFQDLAAPHQVHCVHLTWRVETDRNWPHCERYESLKDFIDRWVDDSLDALES